MSQLGNCELPFKAKIKLGFRWFVCNCPALWKLAESQFCLAHIYVLNLDEDRCLCRHTGSSGLKVTFPNCVQLTGTDLLQNCFQFILSVCHHAGNSSSLWEHSTTLHSLISFFPFAFILLVWFYS